MREMKTLQCHHEVRRLKAKSDIKVNNSGANWDTDHVGKLDQTL